MRDRTTLNLRGRRCLDGAFATELERCGISIEGPLWSARALYEAPEAVLAVHRAYLDAGADVLLTGSYQVSSLGYRAVGLSAAQAKEAAADALRRSVALALEARAQAGRPDALIAASLGPYGAALANGAEFHGEYGFRSEAEEHAALVAFHAERIAMLADTDADLLAFETLPSLAEARAIEEALRSRPELGAWFSFTCRDGVYTVHGERVRECAALTEVSPQIAAVGVNCTSPVWIASLIRELRAATGKPVVVYPNSGEGWDAEQHAWIESQIEGQIESRMEALSGEVDVAGYGALAASWFRAGAQLVGGCCRTGPAHTRAVHAAMEQLARDAR